MLKGYGMSREPARLRQEEQDRILKNKLSGIELEHAPEYYGERSKGQRLLNEEREMSNALKRNNGQEEADLELEKKWKDLEYTEARTQAEKAYATKQLLDSSSTGSPKERRILWNGMGRDAQADIFRIGNQFGWNPQRTQEEFIKGTNFEEEAKKKGIDLTEGGGSYLATGAARTGIINAKSSAAELDVLENLTAKDLSQYGATFGGYSPAQIKDSLLGKDKDAMIRFLGARALQPEIAGARSRIAAGSNAQQALHDAQEAALANFKIPGFTITPEIRLGVQKYINKALKEAFKAREKSVYGAKEKDEIMSEALKNPSLESMSDEELRRYAE